MLRKVKKDELKMEIFILKTAAMGWDGMGWGGSADNVGFVVSAVCVVSVVWIVCCECGVDCVL